jgi:hypothetical protein
MVPSSQGCPGGGQPGSSAHGWHHAASEDLVHWEDRGIHVEAINESYKGFSSDTSPCSGFVTVDDEGVPCAGFRQCGSITGLTGLNPKANKWDAPLEIRCAKNANLTDWGCARLRSTNYFQSSSGFRTLIGKSF